MRNLIIDDIKSSLKALLANAEADLSFVQLIESARMDARAAGKRMRLASPATGSVLKVLKRGGFTDAQSAEDAQFWLHQEVRV
ncbi:hypothetical protein [Rhizobium tumorigenes]|uniref:hypothetical protein n=1 Tax=Rhizobium tumorigenes TaxID=2041385 RepID=UPI00241D50E4|nr:hypothetical protein [Rhizobium tumorigenes]WFS03605.1 hypothetical protein PR016_20285 [Rhizobium tumorigenes]